MKKLLFKRQNNQQHWVGDGFPVRTIFSYDQNAQALSPFLMMDYAGPVAFPPSAHRRGVEEHPHRGFETVTLVFSGQVEHRDSAGGGGVIGPGDVQWMTAARGLVHEEKHGKEFAENGGNFEMVQLWVNLPAKDKMNSPRYQGLKAEAIPVALLSPGNCLRVVAGSYADLKGPALTHTPINLWDLVLKVGFSQTFAVPEGHSILLFVMRGQVRLGSGESIGSATLAVLENAGTDFSLSAEADTQLLVLTGEPIREPIAGYGPFVMNTRQEIQEAILDYQEGRLGTLRAIAGTEGPA